MKPDSGAWAGVGSVEACGVLSSRGRAGLAVEGWLWWAGVRGDLGCLGWRCQVCTRSEWEGSWVSVWGPQSHFMGLAGRTGHGHS